MGVVRQTIDRAPVLTWMGLIQLGLVPVFLVLGIIDDRAVDGLGTWLKPVKFGMSLGVFLLTLALFTAWLKQGATRRLWYRLTVGMLVVGVTYESVWVWQASARGVRSHFNVDTQTENLAFMLAGVFALMLVLGALNIGIGVFRARAARPDKAMASAISWGLFLTFGLTVVTAGMIGSAGGLLGASINGPDQGLFGWRVVGSDLRAAHFFSTHAMQAIPLAGLLLSRFPTALGVWAVRLCSAVYAGFCVYLTRGAMTGRDLPAFLVWPL